MQYMGLLFGEAILAEPPCRFGQPRLHAVPRARYNSNRYPRRYLLPALPFWELREIISPHEENKTREREADLRFAYHINGIGGAKFLFDMTNIHARF